MLLVRLFIAVAPQDVVAEYKTAMGHSTGQPKGKRTASSNPGADTNSKSSKAGPQQPKQTDDVIDADFRVHE